ncbi:MAG: hypothetical protein R3B95_17385 [Nitrospirales bacterium]|nr:hypothetical protein [Nitrospirales bacterium]
MQAIVTICAIFVGAWWTYNTFVKERQSYPHAIIGQTISHIPLSESINLLRLEITLTNTGTSALSINESTMRVQQILPLLPCTSDPCHFVEINNELTKIQKEVNRFTWPLISERDASFKPALDIEPGEKDVIDFEWVFSSEVEVVRVSSYFGNKEKIKGNSGLGWGLSTIYDFRKDGGEERQ